MDLLRAQGLARPVAVTRGLVHLDVDELQGHVLQPVTIGVGADELARRPGAVDGIHADPQVVADGGDVEASEVEDLEDVGSLQEPLEAGRPLLQGHSRVEGCRRDLHECGPSRAIAELHDAEAITNGHEAHRFRIYRQVRRAQMGLELRLGQIAPHDLGQDIGRRVRHGEDITSKQSHA